jgi:hypothetical protein
MLLGLRSLWEGGVVPPPPPPVVSITPGVPKPRRHVVVKVTGVQANAEIGEVIARIAPAVRFVVTGVQSYAGIGTPRIHVVATALHAPLPVLSVIGNVRAITPTDLLDDEIAAILG